MPTNFYDNVARKFGHYSTGVECANEYPDGNAEKLFKEKLLELCGADKHVLDVGCADGRFTLSVAPDFQQITAIDVSAGMLEAARKLQQQKQKGVENVTFEQQDADATTFPDSTFDVVYSRRGPTPFLEFYRVLKTGGSMVEIEIGEKDCQDIKQIFGRGQGFNEWNQSTLEIDKQNLINAGFEVMLAEEFFYTEYYASYADLDLFLQGVPIFEDFDSEKDARLLEEYVAKFSSEKGIAFPRHRVVIVARKANPSAEGSTTIDVSR